MTKIKSEPKRDEGERGITYPDDADADRLEDQRMRDAWDARCR